MRVSILSFALFAAPALCQDAQDARQAPGANDRRAPCPLLNSLANHGYLPRNGMNICVDALIDGMHAGLNLREDAKLFSASRATRLSRPPRRATRPPSTSATSSTTSSSTTPCSAAPTSTSGTTGPSTRPSSTRPSRAGPTTRSRSATRRGRLPPGRRARGRSTPSSTCRLTGTPTRWGRRPCTLACLATTMMGIRTGPGLRNERLPFDLGWNRRGDDDKISATGILALATKVAVHYLAVKIGL